MNHYSNFQFELNNLVGQENVMIDEPMKKHTSFKVGGIVDALVTPESYEQVKAIIKICKEKSVPFYVIGNGSNLLVKDGGIRGLVIKLTKLNTISVHENKIVAGGGAELIDVSQIALKASLTGAEFACGIPGSVGGALTMNAGAYNGEMSQIVESAIVVDREGNVKTLDLCQLELGYRFSTVMKNLYTVLEVTFKLQLGEYDKIKDRMDDLTRRRTEKQPLEYASAGSTFKRPIGTFAPKLIEETGLKGIYVKDAEVSTKHSGFIINKGNADAKDIIELIKIVQKSVKEKFDIELDTEVIIIGED
ncbi:MAG: UDP-N-acetylmuramate dehydrogenase [Clostridiaceae bacterium]|nr:UDP-N-acetylmuramate dehydrogenase [Clostridiaceae bacterium]